MIKDKEIIVAPLLYDSNRFCIYRQNGQEVIVKIINNRIINPTHKLREEEKEAVLTLIKQKEKK